MGGIVPGREGERGSEAGSGLRRVSEGGSASIDEDGSWEIGGESSVVEDAVGVGGEVSEGVEGGAVRMGRTFWGGEVRIGGRGGGGGRESRGSTKTC